MWIRNIVIKKRVEDLQLDIESYQMKLNLTEPNWDASDFLFKEDYTIISKPRAVIYRDRNDQKKMMRESEVHKLPHHLFLIIPISVDYGPWFGNDGVIFFEKKIRCILVRFSEVELHLIALNVKLQVFHPLFDNNVSNPHVDCIEQVNFVRSRQMVELALKMK
uniref:Uncharacterized protein n=1 Tax=Tanacetum cinerariifolium TaxID=118510 RepID=A0A699IW87_TANCI|nr:hypothetical protein [Tanacetum cinerariifolium]